MLTFYDIGIDERREVTQADVDLWCSTVAAFGLLVTFLRKSQRIRDGEAASIAVAVAQGRISPTEGSKALTLLLENAD